MALWRAALLGSLLLAPLAQAQTFPSKPLHMLVGFSPGGANDILARLVSARMADSLGQPVVVENRPGAGGLIATEALVKSPPDGYTLMLGSTGTQTMAPHLYHLKFDAVKGIAPVSLVGSTPSALVVRPTLEVQNVEDLIELAKKKRGLLSYASSGNGTTLHLAAVLFAQMAEIELVHVSYKGNAPALNDLLGGRVDMMFSAMPPLLPLAKANKLRILGVASLERHHSAPDIPTIAEQGLKDYEASTWYGVFTTGRVPQTVIDHLGADVRKAVQDPKVRAAILAQGVDPKSDTPAEFRQLFDAEYQRWGKVIRENHIKAD